jgi:hypothetical protein
MTGKLEPEKGFSLARWSRRKLEATRDAPPSAAPAPAAPALPATAAASAPVELPPVESLTFDSDFTAFLRPEVDADLKRAALKQLFRDPRFNVMDGLDTYIDDYTKADPIPSDMLAGLMQRFGRVAASDETPAVAAVERESPDTTADASPASGEEGVPAEQSAGEGNVPSLGNADERAPVATAAGTGDAIVTSAQDDAQSSAHEVVPPIARNDDR